ncbi:MAG: NAD-dependent epimerase/dehydratase family protein [Thermomicrobia bacterium]|nr:NAD-dependent epimerase/dehydratase family protein [Thermomicrobia bacterium]MCA1723622.1 NAD-dependent epimerase/dehydratase family protein [Thermomicrobia bacterium]
MIEPEQAHWQGMRTLVTGGLGFIGSNLVHRLHALGATVMVVDALIPGHGGNRANLDGLGDEVEVIIGDLRDRDLMENLVATQAVIFNLAGQISHEDSMRDPFTDLEHNTRAPLTLLEACRTANPDVRVVFTGTRQQYGRPQYVPVDERHPMRPVDVNGVNKWAGEYYHLLYHEVYGMRTCSLRLTNCYGPRQVTDRQTQGAFPFFIGRALAGQPITLYDEGAFKRDINYVDDVVEALLLAGEHDAAIGEAFNLGSPPLTLREFVETLGVVVGGVDVHYIPYPPQRKRIEIGDTYCEYGKISRALNWLPRTSLRDGLEQTIAWHQAHG